MLFISHDPEEALRLGDRIAIMDGGPRDYYERVAGKVIDLGPIYKRAHLGWLVPAYVPRDRFSSIADLRDAEVRERLRGRVQGVDPGSGLMRASRAAISAYYPRGWKRLPASAAAMTAPLERFDAGSGSW